MTIVPIPITIGILHAKGSVVGPVTRNCRFRTSVACRLGRLHVERARLWTPEEAGVVAVIGDLDEELAGSEDATRLAQRDALLEQLGERQWIATREVALELFQCAAHPPEVDPARLAGILSDRDEPRMTVPLSSGVPIPQGASAQITARPQHGNFLPERLIIGRNPEHWSINDFRIGNRSQFSQAGDLPGELFGRDQRDVVLQFEVAQTAMDVVLIVTYIGPNPEGEPFYGALMGWSLVDGIYARIALPANTPVRLRIRNEGPTGEFRATWLAEEIASVDAAAQFQPNELHTINPEVARLFQLQSGTP